MEWVREGHIDGQNTHNVSCTISVKEDEWGSVGEWMWENRDTFNGISVLPYDGGTYIQAPFEDITKEKYEELESVLYSLDLTMVVEDGDNTAFQQEAACAGGACEI
jgi:ribonucleoside-diphosphate reductase alpha chain